VFPSALSEGLSERNLLSRRTWDGPHKRAKTNLGWLFLHLIWLNYHGPVYACEYVLRSCRRSYNADGDSPPGYADCSRKCICSKRGMQVAHAEIMLKGLVGQCLLCNIAVPIFFQRFEPQESGAIEEHF
jgi:hypothetical protein